MNKAAFSKRLLIGIIIAAAGLIAVLITALNGGDSAPVSDRSDSVSRESVGTTSEIGISSAVDADEGEASESISASAGDTNGLEVSENDREILRIPNEAAQEFCEMAEGVWVDLKHCALFGESDVVFSFYLFADGGMGYAGYPGGGSRISRIVDAVLDTDGLYMITLYYPEEEYMGMLFRENNADFEIRFMEDGFYPVEDPDSFFTYMGKDLEEAKQAVIAYCKEMAEQQPA